MRTVLNPLTRTVEKDQSQNLLEGLFGRSSWPDSWRVTPNAVWAGAESGLIRRPGICSSTIARVRSPFLVTPTQVVVGSKDAGSSLTADSNAAIAHAISVALCKIRTHRVVSARGGLLAGRA